MTDRYITPGGYGDGSSLSQAAPFSAAFTLAQQVVAAGVKPRLLVVANRGPYPVPMKKGGNLASNGTDSDSLNDGAFLTLNLGTLTIDPDNPLVIEGASDDMVPIEAVLQSDRLRPYTRRTERSVATPGRAVLRSLAVPTCGSATSSSGTSASVAYGLPTAPMSTGRSNRSNSTTSVAGFGSKTPPPSTR